MASISPSSLPPYVGEFAPLGVTKGVVFAALEVDLLLKGSDELFDELGRHQPLAQSIEDERL
jgi:hypothetical protein